MDVSVYRGVTCATPADVACAFYTSNTHSCNALQRTATHCNTLRHNTARINIASYASYASEAHSCNTLQHAATRCNTLQHAAARCIMLQRTVTHCNTHTYTRYTCYNFGLRSAPLQHTTTHSVTLQHTTLCHAATHHKTHTPPAAISA